jgi:SMC interacting uncharacterized protein involved in chromosome segregation
MLDKNKEVEKLKTDIIAKNSEIERIKSNHKSNIRNYEDQISLLHSDIEKLKRKVTKSGGLLDDYETHIAELEGQNRDLTSLNDKLKH